MSSLNINGLLHGIGALDSIMTVTALGALLVAYKRRELTFYLLLFVFGAFIEIGSISLTKGTCGASLTSTVCVHCHAASPFLNIRQCSSLNSILFYGKRICVRKGEAAWQCTQTVD